MTCSNRLLMIIGIGWLLPFWYLPYSAAFVALPTQPRHPRCGFVGLHRLGDTAKDIAFQTRIENRKKDLEEIKARAATEIAKFKNDLDTAEARSMCLTYVSGRLESHMYNRREQAISEVQSIQRKAISDMESVAFDNISAFVKAGNWANRSFPGETILQEMERIRAEGLKKIEDISAKLEKDAEAAAEAFEKLTAAIK